MNEPQPQNDLEALAWQVARKMYGYNYAPSLGVLKIAQALDLTDVQQAIKTEYELTDPALALYETVDSNSMLTEIQKCFDYRGDHGSGLEITPEQEISLKDVQQKFMEAISGYISGATALYSTNIESGLPIDAMFWYFSFVILNPQHESLFIFGGASD